MERIDTMLAVGKVNLEEYNPKWTKLFLNEKHELEGLLGDYAKTI